MRIFLEFLNKNSQVANINQLINNRRSAIRSSPVKLNRFPENILYFDHKSNSYIS